MGVSIVTGCFHFQLTKEIQRDQKGGDSLLDDYMLSGKYSRTSLGTRVAMWTHLLDMTKSLCKSVRIHGVHTRWREFDFNKTEQISTISKFTSYYRLYTDVYSVATWSDYKHHTTMKLFVYEYDLILRNKCLRDIIFIYFPAVPNRFKYRHNACFRDIYFKTNFSAISNSLKYHQNAWLSGKIFSAGPNRFK